MRPDPDCAALLEVEEEPVEVFAATLALVEAIEHRQPFVALIGMAADAPAILEATITALHGAARFARVANPLQSPLTVARILLQIGAEPADEPEQIALNALAALAGDHPAGCAHGCYRRASGKSHARRIVDAGGAAWNSMAPGTGEVQVLFVGAHDLWTLFRDDRSGLLARLINGGVIEGAREQERDDAGQARVAIAGPPVSTIVPVSWPTATASVLRRLPWRLLATAVSVAAVALCGLAAVRLFADRPPLAAASVPAEGHDDTGRCDNGHDDAGHRDDRDRPRGDDKCDGQVRWEKAATSPANLPPDGSGSPDEARLRTEFNRFLTRFRPDLATLTRAQRNALFRDYIEHRASKQANATQVVR